jgi:hypothetical protein
LDRVRRAGTDMAGTWTESEAPGRIGRQTGGSAATKLDEMSWRREGLSKKMLKTMIDPAMCMKTNGRATECPTGKRAFGRNLRSAGRHCVTFVRDFSLALPLFTLFPCREPRPRQDRAPPHVRSRAHRRGVAGGGPAAEAVFEGSWKGGGK